MKKILLAATIMLLSATGFAQTDTAKTKKDTLHAGGFVIVKKGKKTTSINIGTNGIDIYTNDSSKKKKNTSTNWWIMDIGFANMRDETNYSALSGSYFKTVGTRPAINANSFRLNQTKTSNVNIWFFMQRLNISKHVLNLKYGLGTEMYNIRYENSLSYRKDGGSPYVFNDSVGFSKNKLFAAYLTVPLMINVNTNPNKRKAFGFSAGVSAGYLFKSRNKQISNERGKNKYYGNFDLQPFRLAAIAELSLGPVRLYGTYSLNKLHNDNTNLQQYPYAIGIRLSSW